MHSRRRARMILIASAVAARNTCWRFIDLESKNRSVEQIKSRHENDNKAQDMKSQDEHFLQILETNINK